MEIQNSLGTALIASILGTIGLLLSLIQARTRRAEAMDEERRFLASLNARQTSTPAAPSTGPQEATLNELGQRVTALEGLIPADSEIDKYASVNDALLDSGLNHLRARVATIEAQMLNRWDVAVVVFAVLASIGVLSSALFGVAAYVKD